MRRRRGCPTCALDQRYKRSMILMPSPESRSRSVHVVGVEMERGHPLPDGQLSVPESRPSDRWFSRHIDDTAEHFLSDRHLDRAPSAAAEHSGTLMVEARATHLATWFAMCSSTSRTTVPS